VVNIGTEMQCVSHGLQNGINYGYIYFAQVLGDINGTRFKVSFVSLEQIRRTRGVNVCCWVIWMRPEDDSYTADADAKQLIKKAGDQKPRSSTFLGGSRYQFSEQDHGMRLLYNCTNCTCPSNFELHQTQFPNVGDKLSILEVFICVEPITDIAESYYEDVKHIVRYLLDGSNTNTTKITLIFKEFEEKCVGIHAAMEIISKRGDWCLDPGVLEAKVHKLDNEKHLVLEQVIIAAFDCNRIEVADKCIGILSKEFSGSLRVQKFKAMRLEALELYDEAVEALDAIITADETNADPRKRKIAILKARGKTSDAIKEMCDYLKKYNLRALFGLYLCCNQIAGSEAAANKRKEAQTLGQIVLTKIQSKYFNENLSDPVSALEAAFGTLEVKGDGPDLIES